MRSLFLWAQALAFVALTGCSVSKLNTDNRSCPCTKGYVCVRDVCVPGDDVKNDAGSDASKQEDSSTPQDSGMQMDAHVTHDAAMDSAVPMDSGTDDAAVDWCTPPTPYPQTLSTYAGEPPCSMNTAVTYAACGTGAPGDTCRNNAINADPNPTCEGCYKLNLWKCANDAGCQSKWETLACCANGVGGQFGSCPSNNSQYNSCVNTKRPGCRATAEACLPTLAVPDGGVDSGMPDGGSADAGTMDAGSDPGWCDGHTTPYLQNPTIDTTSKPCSQSTKSCVQGCLGIFPLTIFSVECYRQCFLADANPACGICAENNTISCLHASNCATQIESLACCSNKINRAPSSGACSDETTAFNFCALGNGVDTLYCAGRRSSCLP